MLLRKLPLVLMAVGVLVASAAPAYASTPKPMMVPPTSTQTGGVTSLTKELGPDSGGIYLDDVGHVHAAVTTTRAFAQAKAAGAVPKMVQYSTADLTQAMSALYSTARVSGTAWGVDPTTDQVVV